MGRFAPKISDYPKISNQDAVDVNKKMKLLPEHVLGARGILRMSQAELAELATVSDRTIQHFEAGKMHLKDETLLRLQMALEHCGIEFFNTGKPGVRYHPERDRRRMTRSEPSKPLG